MSDMRIRRAAAADLPALTRLWQTAFGDPPELIGAFYHRFPPETAAWVVEAGGNVALGSDQAPGNNCHNIIHEMKNVCMFNKLKYQNPEIMPAWKALRMATIEGAKAVGVDDIVGSLEPGKQADFIAIDLNYPSMLPVYTYPMRNIVPNLVYSARGQEVALSVVNGRVIMKDQKILTIDENESFSSHAQAIRIISFIPNNRTGMYSVYRKTMLHNFSIQFINNAIYTFILFMKYQ